jgi:hypothetical protein
MRVTTLLSVIMSTLLLPAPSALSQRAGHHPDALTTFTNALAQDGFDMALGIASAWNVPEEWCASTPGIDTALYANNEPYVVVKVPQTVKGSQLSPYFKLQPDEAIVLIGLTPPPARYFSYTPYLVTRVYPDGKTLKPFASLGDSVNNATVRTTGSSPFNSPVALIFTPDQGTDARVRAALQRAGYPPAIVNTVVFPASMLNLGYDENADFLLIALRNAIWLNKAEGEAYIANPQLSVFKVKPRTPATANPFPVPPVRVRGTGQTELDLKNKLDQLRQGIIAANPGLHATDIVLSPMCNDGCDLIQRGIELCIDSRDALYIGAGLPEWDPLTNHITLAEDEFLMIYGPNHVATGKATYMNINVYASETAKLTLGTIDDRNFTNNTAKPYLPADDPAADAMYAYKISRSCAAGEANCKPLSVPQGCTRLTLDSSTLLGVFTRIYLEPATGVGPAPSEILYDRVIKFSPRR